MKMKSIFIMTFLYSSNAFSQSDDAIVQYRSDVHTRASDFAKSFFGGSRNYLKAKRIDMGNVGLEVSSDLNCGQLDLKANVTGEFKNVQDQIAKLIPKKFSEMEHFFGTITMLSTCYAYPTVCAELRHDFLSLKANLNLRSQACQAIDKYIDNQADKGRKELLAEAQADCVAKSNKDPATALSKCQDETTGLGIRDFQSGLEKKFTKKKQKVLQSIVKFSKMSDPKTYEFLSSILGEIEVQSDGYWQPLFSNGMFRPNDVAHEFLVEGTTAVCQNLSNIIENKKSVSNTIFEQSVVEVVKNRVTKEDLLNINDLNDGDKELACTALGRSIGQVAAQKTAAAGEAVIASGLTNTAIPNSLRNEFRSRSDTAFLALKKTVESEQIPSVDEVRRAISKLAFATREKNKIIASQLSQNKIQNALQESLIKSDCTDSLSCGEL